MQNDMRGCAILGGPLDLVTTKKWAYNPTYIPPQWAYGGLPQL